ncbi:Bcr/CflA family efflux MFS transporter [Siccirubricoccus sp. KC 17139]|uniref:Bcr/CflA family efflux transporter n=1 Tax=Siccirubricoccus soli TaxID=2899147 RepID=A0ABT1D135_9PROT|nr:Bcr/CflA family efflux MFS transporter [Siccirubricoccus soli]MCO6415621.1 Bcr/CflA family efflux MFS transporter [Siccirubricoccus soli]MCP2681753.1 Bcr/CflA family efflux MFS transporter [Siccirubricoccus soli]
MSTKASRDAAKAAQPAGKGRAPLWLLALITFSGTLAMHVFVPALPQAAAALGASPGATQLTISFYILGLALGQLVYGPVSDRFGRRPVLVFGLVLYALAGFAALLAPNVHLLILARLLQALGGCSGLVLGRAMVRDGATPGEAAQRLALMNLMVVAGPGIAPLIGTLLAETAGWRSILLALAGLGIFNLLLAWKLLPETGGGAGKSAGAVLRSYLGLLRTPAFLGFTLGGGCASTAMYAYVAAAPFIFIDQLHRPGHEVGFYLALNFLGLWLGTLAASRLAGRLGAPRLLVHGNLLSLIGAVGFLAAILTGVLDVKLTVLTMALFSFGVGTAAPAALAEAMSVNPLVVGSASGLYGFGQMGIGGISTSLAGIGGNPALAAALVLVSAGVIAQFSFRLALRGRRG